MRQRLHMDAQKMVIAGKYALLEENGAGRLNWPVLGHGILARLSVIATRAWLAAETAPIPSNVAAGVDSLNTLLEFLSL